MKFIYLNKSSFCRDNRNCLSLLNRHGETIVENDNLFTLKPFDIAAYPTWKIDSPKIRHEAEIKALNSIYSLQLNLIEKMQQSFLEEFGEDAEVCLIYQQQALVFLPADDRSRHGEVGYVQIGFSMLGPTKSGAISKKCSCDIRTLLISGCICGGE